MWWEGVLVTELAPHSDDLGIMVASGLWRRGTRSPRPARMDRPPRRGVYLSGAAQPTLAAELVHAKGFLPQKAISLIRPVLMLLA